MSDPIEKYFEQNEKSFERIETQLKGVADKLEKIQGGVEQLGLADASLVGDIKTLQKEMQGATSLSNERLHKLSTEVNTNTDDIKGLQSTTGSQGQDIARLKQNFLIAVGVLTVILGLIEAFQISSDRYLDAIIESRIQKATEAAEEETEESIRMLRNEINELEDKLP